MKTLEKIIEALAMAWGDGNTELLGFKKHTEISYYVVYRKDEQFITHQLNLQTLGLNSGTYENSFEKAMKTFEERGH